MGSTFFYVSGGLIVYLFIVGIVVTILNPSLKEKLEESKRLLIHWVCPRCDNDDSTGFIYSEDNKQRECLMCGLVTDAHTGAVIPKQRNRFVYGGKRI